MKQVKTFFIHIGEAIKSRLTMENTGSFLFRDSVNGGKVWIYKDCYGTEYMAQSKWAIRCKMRR